MSDFSFQWPTAARVGLRRQDGTQEIVLVSRVHLRPNTPMQPRFYYQNRFFIIFHISWPLAAKNGLMPQNLLCADSTLYSGVNAFVLFLIYVLALPLEPFKKKCPNLTTQSKIHYPPVKNLLPPSELFRGGGNLVQSSIIWQRRHGAPGRTLELLNRIIIGEMRAKLLKSVRN